MVQDPKYSIREFESSIVTVVVVHASEDQKRSPSVHRVGLVDMVEGCGVLKLTVCLCTRHMR